MKTLLKQIVFVSLMTSVLVVLSGCDDIDGRVVVKSQINLIKNKKPVLISTGNYDASIKAASKKEITLEIELNKKRKTSFAFKFPPGKNLEKGGEIIIPAATSGQPYDAVGATRIDYSRSGPVSSVESCSWTETERHCGNVVSPIVCEVATECDPNNPNQCERREKCTGGESAYVCEDVSITRTGSRDVDYHISYKTRSGRFQLMSPGTQEVVASFAGSETTSSTVYDYQGICQ